MFNACILIFVSQACPFSNLDCMYIQSLSSVRRTGLTEMQSKRLAGTLGAWLVAGMLEI